MKEIGKKKKEEKVNGGKIDIGELDKKISQISGKGGNVNLGGEKMNVKGYKRKDFEGSMKGRGKMIKKGKRNENKRRKKIKRR